MIETQSAKATEQMAKNWVDNLAAKPDQATVVALWGDLGSGKTTFVQGVAKALDLDETIISPTFVIMKLYPVMDHAWIKQLVHIDAYRLERPGQVDILGWQDLIPEPGNLICIEWPERIADKLPQERENIVCTFIDETTRRYEFDKSI